MAAGSIIIDLLMKTGSFETDSKRAEKRLQEMEKTAKKVGTAIGVAMVAAGTAVAAMLKSAIDTADEMSKTAQKVGIATEELSRLAYAGELADVSLGDLQSSMGRLIKAMGDAQSKTSTQARIFDALGISVTDASGKMRSASDVLSDFADAFQEQEGSPEIIAAGMEIFGRSFQTLIPLLKDGAAGLREAGAEADALGVTLSTETGRQAEAFNDNLTRLGKAANGLALQVAADLLPDLENLTDRFVSLVTEGDGVSTLAHDIAQGFRVMESAAESSITLVSGVAEVVGGLTQQLAGFYEIAASLSTLDWERRAAGAAMYRAGGQQINIGADRLVNPHGPNGLFNNQPARTGTYNGPLLAPSKWVEDAEFQAEVRMAKEAREHAKRLREALGDLPATASPTGRGSKEASAAKELREQERAMRALLDADQALYDQMLAGVDATTEQMQAWATLTAQLDGPLARAQLEHERRLQEIEQTGRAAGRTAEEIAAAKAKEERAYRGVTAAILEQQRVLANPEATRLLDDFRYEASDTLSDLVRNFEEADKIIGNFFDNLAERITDAVANHWIDQLLGAPGTSGEGSAAGGSIFGFLAGIFGGARASGGDVIGGRAYLVGEDGPELYVPRTAGMVLNAGATAALAGGGSGMTQTNHFHYAAPPDPRTQEQTAARVGFEARRALARNG